MYKTRPKSALTTILLALVPYTRQNIMLTYRPSQFFAELERSSSYSQPVLKAALYRGVQKGYISSLSTPYLTCKGTEEIGPYTAATLKGDVYLMVVFDIPEGRAPARRQLRSLLRRLEFTQIQKSVWVSKYDYRAIVKKAISELKVNDCVLLYESALLSTSN